LSQLHARIGISDSEGMRIWYSVPQRLPEIARPKIKDFLFENPTELLSEGKLAALRVGDTSSRPILAANGKQKSTKITPCSPDTEATVATSCRQQKAESCCAQHGSAVDGCAGVVVCLG
jgi:hypothetical protein